MPNSSTPRPLKTGRLIIDLPDPSRLIANDSADHVTGGHYGRPDERLQRKQAGRWVGHFGSRQGTVIQCGAEFEILRPAA